MRLGTGERGVCAVFLCFFGSVLFGFCFEQGWVEVGWVGRDAGLGWRCVDGLLTVGKSVGDGGARHSLVCCCKCRGGLLVATEHKLIWFSIPAVFLPCLSGTTPTWKTRISLTTWPT